LKSYGYLSFLSFTYGFLKRFLYETRRDLTDNRL
jgi:hypothetical protein